MDQTSQREVKCDIIVAATINECVSWLLNYSLFIQDPGGYCTTQYQQTSRFVAVKAVLPTFYWRREGFIVRFSRTGSTLLFATSEF